MQFVKTNIHVVSCKWIGDGEGCNRLAMPEKCYCETHHARVYDVYPRKMAEFIIEKEIDNEY